MTATAHALVGGAIAASVNNPALGLTLATISHPILDKIPHWDVGWGWRKKSKLRFFLESITDLGIGVISSYFIFGQNLNPLYFWGAVFLSESWDILEAPYWFFRWKFPPFGIIYQIQSKMQGKAALPWGILTQIAAVIITVLLLKAWF